MVFIIGLSILAAVIILALIKNVKRPIRKRKVVLEIDNVRYVTSKMDHLNAG